MKYLPFGIIIVLAVVVGFFLGRFTGPKSADDNIVTDRTIIRDTVIKEKTIQIYHPKENETIEVDELPIDTLLGDIDTSLTQETLLDTSDNDLSISREKLLKSLSFPVSYINESDPELDSTLQESLGIKPKKPKYISVEFWESPLNFEGYKLSKSKLVLYGVTTQFKFEFIRNGERSFLASDEISYELTETDKFKPLKIVSNAEVYAD